MYPFQLVDREFFTEAEVAALQKRTDEACAKAGDLPVNNKYYVAGLPQTMRELCECLQSYTAARTNAGRALRAAVDGWGGFWDQMRALSKEDLAAAVRALACARAGGDCWEQFMRRFAGKTVEISITTWGGTIVVITGKFANATSRFMICLRPVEGGSTVCHVIPFGPRLHNPLARMLVQPLSLWVRRKFTGGYLIAETEALGSPRYNPQSLIEPDGEMIDYFNWVADLSATGDAGPTAT